jgi:hypothetical protein
MQHGNLQYEYFKRLEVSFFKANLGWYLKAENAEFTFQSLWYECNCTFCAFLCSLKIVKNPSDFFRDFFLLVFISKLFAADVNASTKKSVERARERESFEKIWQNLRKDFFFLTSSNFESFFGDHTIKVRVKVKTACHDFDLFICSR